MYIIWQNKYGIILKYAGWTCSFVGCNLITAIAPQDFLKCLVFQYFGAYPMKVIPERRRPHLFRYLRFHYYHQVDSSPGGLLVTECIIRPVASVSALTWFIRYIYDRNLKFLNNVIIIKTKVLLIQTQIMTIADFGCPVLACLFNSSKNT